MSWRDRIAAEDIPPTDLGNRDRLVARHGAGLRFVTGLGWLAWNGTVWQRGAKHVAKERAAETIRALLHEAIESADRDDRDRLVKHAMASESARALRAIIELAESHPEVRLSADALDPDPWALNVANGILDLRTGTLGAHDPDALCTRLAPVEFRPGATAPTWLHFLERVQPDPEVRAYLQRWIGYCLTGDMSEQVFVFLHGGGSNGKGVFEATIRSMLGSYASSPAFDTFAARRVGAATNDLVDLMGVRLASASEPEEGCRLAEAVLKRITGEDPITARRLYKEHVTFNPVCKIQLVGNHRPRIRGGAHAFWRRVHLVPWLVTIHDPDPDLKRKLLRELPGILAWALAGCRASQHEGLMPPAAVLNAVQDYRKAEDHVGRFISDCCRVGPGLVVATGPLRRAYEKWCRAEGEEPLSIPAFGRSLEDRGLSAIKDQAGIRGRGRQGLALGGDCDGCDALAQPRTNSSTRARARDFDQECVNASQASQAKVPSDEPRSPGASPGASPEDSTGRERGQA